VEFASPKKEAQLLQAWDEALRRSLAQVMSGYWRNTAAERLPHPKSTLRCSGRYHEWPLDLQSVFRRPSGPLPGFATLPVAGLKPHSPPVSGLLPLFLHDEGLYVKLC